MFSKFFRLNLNDFQKGLICAIFGAVLGALEPIISSGSLPDFTDWKKMGMGAVYAGFAYLSKNLVTNSQGKIKTEPPPD